MPWFRLCAVAVCPGWVVPAEAGGIALEPAERLALPAADDEVHGEAPPVAGGARAGGEIGFACGDAALSREVAVGVGDEQRAAELGLVGGGHRAEGGRGVAAETVRAAGSQRAEGARRDAPVGVPTPSRFAGPARRSADGAGI